jgi:hypothetical protein
MSYAKLGNVCSSYPLAITTSTKFIPFYSSIYKNQCTRVLKQPGDSMSYQRPHEPTHSHDSVNPEEIKSYHENINHQKCSTC